jgi:hypothetical protein
MSILENLQSIIDEERWPTKWNDSPNRQDISMMSKEVAIINPEGKYLSIPSILKGKIAWLDTAPMGGFIKWGDFLRIDPKLLGQIGKVKPVDKYETRKSSAEGEVGSSFSDEPINLPKI